MKSVSYLVELESRAEREFLALPKDVLRLVAEVFDSLSAEPRPPGAKKLIAQEGYRVRKGQYRILYTIDDTKKIVRIYKIGHRREVYR